MKVSELIAKLQACNPDLPVVIDGYEGGYDDVGTVEPVNIVLDATGGVPYGQHGYTDWYPDKPSVQAVYLRSTGGGE